MSSIREAVPKIHTPDREHLPEERMEYALAEFYMNKAAYNAGETKLKPKVARIARIYHIPRKTLNNHLKNPNITTKKVHNESMQVLTPLEETALANRLLFMDQFNVPADRKTLFELAHNLLHEREPERILGKRWIYAFLRRNPACHFVKTKNIERSRYNAAQNWDVLDDFYAKVVLIHLIEYRIVIDR